MATRVLVIDNYDSFVYNLVQELGELGADPVVHRNDAIDVDGIRAAGPDLILISPGPGRPEDAGVSVAVIEELAGVIPILGVCLGHQAIGQAFGGRIVRAPTLMHGKTSAIHHDGKGVFAGLPDPFTATRYHSLVVEPDTVPDVLEVTARTTDGGDHGPASPDAGRRGCAVPPRVAADPGGPVAVGQLPGLSRQRLSRTRGRASRPVPLDVPGQGTLVVDVGVVELVVVLDVGTDEDVVVVVGGGPWETWMSTGLPGVTLAPVPGFDDTTMPGPYWVE